MGSYILWSALVWTFKGLLFTWRFFWVSPYQAIKTAPRQAYGTVGHGGEGWDHARRLKAKLPLQQRVSTVEDDIQDLRNQLNSQRESWEKRFVKLQRRQQDLQNQLTSETWVRSGLYMGQEGLSLPRELLLEAVLESKSMGQYSQQDQDDDLTRSSFTQHEAMSLKAEESSQMSSSFVFDSRSPSALSVNTNISMGSWRSSAAGPHRVFAPHTPQDLQLGHRVRVLLASGRISTGTVRYLGPISSSQEQHLGVELERPDNGTHTGVHQGQLYFDCSPGHGAFVPFHKLLMAWE